MIWIPKGCTLAKGRWALLLLTGLLLCSPTWAVKKPKASTHHVAHKKHHQKSHHLAKRERAIPNGLEIPALNVPAYFYKDKLPEGMHSTSPSISEHLLASTSTKPQSTSSRLVRSVETGVVDFVHDTVATLRYSDYKLGGRKFDPNRGVYVLDCSSFVDNILQKMSPHAFTALVNNTGSTTPATQHYYNYFKELSESENSPYWNTITDVNSLRAGDILVFRYQNSRGAQTGGHVMVVMDTPVHDTNVYFVRVADSAPSRHSQDTRQPNEAGIGIGTLLLKANPLTGKPLAFAWGVGSYWNSRVKFAMARPVDVV